MNEKTDTLSNYSKGALTHHLVVANSISLAPPLCGRSHSFRCSSSPHKAGFAGSLEAVVSLPLVRVVRSPRGMWLLRKPMDNAAISVDTVIIVHTDGELNIEQFTICFHKTATGSFMKIGSRLNCFHYGERYLATMVMCRFPSFAELFSE